MILKVKTLHAGYRPIEIIQDVSFSLKEGGTLALLGRNGTGKTTLLRAICGLADRISGEVEIDGRRLPPRQPERLSKLGVAFVPDSRGVFARLSVRENLRLARLQAYSGNRPDVLELFPDLARRLDQAAGTLSGGQQQQLAIARALAMGPRLLIIDELTQGLQPSIINLLSECLSTVVPGLGIALILVDQNPYLAASICQEIIVLDHGHVAARGESKSMLADTLVTSLLTV